MRRQWALRSIRAPDICSGRWRRPWPTALSHLKPDDTPADLMDYAAGWQVEPALARANREISPPSVSPSAAPPRANGGRRSLFPLLSPFRIARVSLGIVMEPILRVRSAQDCRRPHDT